MKIRPLVADELPICLLKAFMAVCFSHHSEIIAKVKDTNQRLFYIEQCAVGFWSKDKLIYNLKDNLFEKKGLMPNNFIRTITNDDLLNKSLRSFKDEYFLDFVNVEDPDDIDGRVLELEIVHNIKSFIMALGGDFSLFSCNFKILSISLQSHSKTKYHVERIKTHS